MVSSFSQLYVQIRDYRRFTNSEFARLLGTSRQRLEGVEDGTVTYTCEPWLVAALARYYWGTPTQYLAEVEATRPQKSGNA